MTASSHIHFQIHPSGSTVQRVIKGAQDAFVVGRKSETGSRLNDLHVLDDNVARRHCRIFREPGAGQPVWMVEDLGSNGGTLLEGRPVLAPTPLPQGAWIQVGTTRIALETDGPGIHNAQTVAMARTVLAPPADDDDEAATLVADPDAGAVAPDDRTIACTDGERTLVDSPAAAVVAVDPAEAADRVDAADVADPALAEAPPSAAAPGGSAVRLAMESEIISDLIQRHFLEPGQTVNLMRLAQARGETFFRTVARDRSLRFHNEIYVLIQQRFGWGLITDEAELASRVSPTEWLPFAMAAELGLVVLRSEKAADPLWYGTIDPFDLVAHDWVQRCAGRRAERVLVHPDVFFPTMRRLKDQRNQEAPGVGLSIDFSDDDEARVRDVTGHVDVPQMVNYFLHRAHMNGASDIHIEPTEEQMIVRNRVDGILHEEISMPKALHAEAVSRLKILSGMDVAEKRRPQDGRMAVTIRNNPIDIRVSSYPTVYGEKFVLRLLDKNALRPSVDTLGLMDRDLRLLKEKLNAPHGLIMISGPTGSGKTTTLYSCLGGLDKTSKNVLTVEDPVEYQLPGVHQMQVNSKIGLTFASGLRTILRQDPDVIMVGEIRDTETAAMAVQAALTGHLVFSTIHTNDAVGVISRLRDMGIEPFLISNALSLAIAQRLVRTICGHCRVAVPGVEILQQLHNEGVTQKRLETLNINIIPDFDYTQGGGCDRCRGTGYSGRQAVFELFEVTDEARSLILSKELNAGDLKRLSREKGMTSLITHGLQLVEDEVTTFQEIVRVLGEES